MPLFIKLRAWSILFRTSLYNHTPVRKQGRASTPRHITLLNPLLQNLKPREDGLLSSGRDDGAAM